jgi:hypothetical protein
MRAVLQFNKLYKAQETRAPGTPIRKGLKGSTLRQMSWASLYFLLTSFTEKMMKEVQNHFSKTVLVTSQPSL